MKFPKSSTYGAAYLHEIVIQMNPTDSKCSTQHVLFTKSLKYWENSGMDIKSTPMNNPCIVNFGGPMIFPFSGPGVPSGPQRPGSMVWILGLPLRPRHSMLRLQEKLRRMGGVLWRAQPQPLQAAWNHWVKLLAGGKYGSDLVSHLWFLAVARQNYEVFGKCGLD